jgi:hypothetical protein
MVVVARIMVDRSIAEMVQKGFRGGSDRVQKEVQGSERVQRGFREGSEKVQRRFRGSEKVHRSEAVHRSRGGSTEAVQQIRGGSQIQKSGFRAVAGDSK